MNNRFYNITEVEMDSFLCPQGFQRMSIPGTTELVYGKLVRHGNHQISMRIYTSIDPTGNSRARGEDAIRVMLFFKYAGEVVSVGKPQKVLRITTWSKNLQKAIDRWDSEFKICPACHHPMVIRKGSNGDFWGCCTWSKTRCSGKPSKIISAKTSDVAPAPVNTVKLERPKVSTKVESLKPVVEAKPPVKPVVHCGASGFRISEEQISNHQKQAEDVFVNTDKHLILPSRAGGGKTTMLKHLASFRKEGHRMAYLAFNRKNANEGKKKLPPEVSAMTTHSFCGRLLRDNQIKMPEKADSGKNWQIMEQVYPAMGNKDRKRLRKAAFKLIGLSKNFAIRPGDKEGIRSVHDQYTFELENEQEINAVVEIVDEVLGMSVPGSRFGSIYDFDDMIWWPIVLNLKLTFYDVVLLDEVQDFNACQIELVSRMIESGTRVVAVGDPYQAVYRFRGADCDAFDKLAAVLNNSKLGCDSVLLPTNFRCGKAILEWVRNNTVVKDIEAAYNAVEGEVREDLTYDQIIEILTEEFGNKRSG
jgi:ssDNA-binding Zn-finger/Zn-ribbon topoisomerase 1